MQLEEQEEKKRKRNPAAVAIDITSILLVRVARRGKLPIGQRSMTIPFPLGYESLHFISMVGGGEGVGFSGSSSCLFSSSCSSFSFHSPMHRSAPSPPSQCSTTYPRPAPLLPSSPGCQTPGVSSFTHTQENASPSRLTLASPCRSVRGSSNSRLGWRLSGMQRIAAA